MNCDRCDEEIAIVSCAKCSFNFCSACDTEVHAVARMKDHTREVLPDAPQGQGPTPSFSNPPPQSNPPPSFSSPPPQSSPPSFSSPPPSFSTSPPPQRPQPFVPPSNSPQRFQPSVPQQFPPKPTPRFGDPGIPPPPADDFIPPPPPDDAPFAPPVPTQAPQRPQPPSPQSIPPKGASFQIPPSQSQSNIPPKGGSFQIPPSQSQSNIPRATSPLRNSSEPPSQQVGTQVEEFNASGGTPKNHKLVLVGTGGVGKSAVTIRFTQGTFTEDEYDPTIEDSYKKNLVVDGKNFILDILDTAGQEEYASLRDNYMRIGHGFILLYAINSRATWNEVVDLRNHILRAKDVSSVPMVLVGNKCDLENDRKVTYEEGQQLAQKWGCAFIEASAKGNINVVEIFQTVIREVMKAPPPEDSTNDDKKKMSKKFSIKSIFGKK